MNPHTVTLSDLVRSLLDQGFHPNAIRRQLSARGIHWRINYTRQQGQCEQARRRRQFRLCDNGDGRSRAHGSTLCHDCLAAKWGQ